MVYWPILTPGTRCSGCRLAFFCGLSPLSLFGEHRFVGIGNQPTAGRLAAQASQLYGTNLTDTRGIVYSTFTQWIKQDTVIRPRTLSLRFGYKFSSQ